MYFCDNYALAVAFSVVTWVRTASGCHCFDAAVTSFSAAFAVDAAMAGPASAKAMAIAGTSCDKARCIVDSPEAAPTRSSRRARRGMDVGAGGGSASEPRPAVPPDGTPAPARADIPIRLRGRPALA